MMRTAWRALGRADLLLDWLARAAAAQTFEVILSQHTSIQEPLHGACLVQDFAVRRIFLDDGGHLLYRYSLVIGDLVPPAQAEISSHGVAAYSIQPLRHHLPQALDVVSAVGSAVALVVTPEPLNGGELTVVLGVEAAHVARAQLGDQVVYLGQRKSWKSRSLASRFILLPEGQKISPYIARALNNIKRAKSN